MAASISFRAPQLVSPDLEYIIDIKCKILEKVLEEDRENKILEKLKKEKSSLQNLLDIEEKEFNNKKKILEQICNQRKIYDLEKEIENTISSNYFLTSETGESLEHHPKDLISSIKAMRNKSDIHNVLINADQLNELILETRLKLEEFQANEGNVINEIDLAKDLPLLNEYLYKSYDEQKNCAEVLGLIERLTLHAQALASVKNYVTEN